MEQVIIHLAGIGELYKLSLEKSALDFLDSVKEYLSFPITTYEDGFDMQICLIKSDLFCSAFWAQEPITSKIQIQPLNPSLSKHLSEGIKTIVSMGQIYINRKFILEIEEPWHYFNPELIKLANVNLNQESASGILPSFLSYDGENIIESQIDYIASIDDGLSGARPNHYSSTKPIVDQNEHNRN